MNLICLYSVSSAPKKGAFYHFLTLATAFYHVTTTSYQILYLLLPLEHIETVKKNLKSVVK